eukprot:CAMPEP_0202362974 /NCGR_PEP_ID=MMETSP1126-20121109/14953_1 /ASSEMBLY_ACC=CAM_ASM_000457 /TAXON_ID=3047 /ORGANISM="Dunaliella tertiolecta, Strain CCMP1320" /LENGTH=344 /DNA_ID=CAMNT_0048957295 /DNA_START=8 /DNA_END=1042 /DNA_ORIENTATION=+
MDPSFFATAGPPPQQFAPQASQQWQALGYFASIPAPPQAFSSAPPIQAPMAPPAPPPKAPGSASRGGSRGAFQQRGGGGGRGGGGRGFAHKGPNLHSVEGAKQKRRGGRGRGGGGRFFHGKDRTPRVMDAPNAPDNSAHSFLAPGSTLVSPAQGSFHNVTPCPFTGAGGVWKQGFGSVDKEAIEMGAKAGIDLHGTNAGLIGEDEDFNTDEEHDMFDDAHVQGADKDQQSYIAELEERNMNLQEKVYLLEEQLHSLTSGRAGSAEMQQEEQSLDEHSNGPEEDPSGEEQSRGQGVESVGGQEQPSGHEQQHGQDLQKEQDGQQITSGEDVQHEGRQQQPAASSS